MSNLIAKELFSTLWNASTEMKMKMSADVYKNYLLGLIFYKSFSDRYLSRVSEILENKRIPIDEIQKLYENLETAHDEKWENLCKELKSIFGCIIDSKHTFTSLCEQAKNAVFDLDNLKEAFKNIENSQDKLYQDLFIDFDIESRDLGKTKEDRNTLVSNVIKTLEKINLADYDDDVLGDTYEYLIEQFASEPGKKSGEFYTPQSVSKIIARIVTNGRESTQDFSIYDPCCGSGSLFLQVKNFLNNKKSVQIYGQEINNQTYNLARMNMMLHGVPPKNQHLNNGDTLGPDWPQGENNKFDACVMNPPYSLKWDPSSELLKDNRFKKYEKLAPKSTADYAFLLHGLSHLKDDGTMGIVLPHGVLFRSGAEGVIRKHLIEDGNIYAVIGLPGGLFFNTGIPTCVIILKKNNQNKDILFIDASKDFIKNKTKNYLTDEHIEKILSAYFERKDIEKYAHLASYEEIKSNDYNLNIPRYVDTFEEEEEIDLEKEFKALAENNRQIEEVTKQLNEYFKELGLNFKLDELGNLLEDETKN